ncbi:type II secretion system protein N [Luteimonas sp. A534]
MSPRRLAWWFSGSLVLGLLLSLPLQLVLPRLSLPSGLSAIRVEGSLWRGTLRQAQWRGAALGDLRMGLSPLPLLAGRQKLWLHGPDARLALQGGRASGIGDAHGVVPLPPLAGLALRASLDGARMLFDGDGCSSAGGRVRIEVSLPGDALPPVILAGTPACDGRSGTLALLSEDTGGPLVLEATFTLDADGSYGLQTLARSDDPGIRAVLLAAGFQAAPGGLSRVDAGRLEG